MLAVVTGGGVANKRRPCGEFETAVEGGVNICGSGWTATQMAFWNTCAWCAFSVGLGLFVMGTGSGEMGTAVNSFLSKPCFACLSKCGYAIYLIHPLVIDALILPQRYSATFSLVNLVTGLFVVFVAVFLAGVALTACIEIPFKTALLSASTRYGNASSVSFSGKSKEEREEEAESLCLSIPDGNGAEEDETNQLWHDKKGNYGATTPSVSDVSEEVCHGRKSSGGITDLSFDGIFPGL